MERQESNRNRRDVLSAIVAGTSLSVAGCMGIGDGDGNGESDIVALGTSNGGANFETMQALQGTLSEQGEVAQVSAQETPGSIANIRLYDQGQVDGYVSSILAYLNAIEDAGSFADEPVENLPHQVFNVVELPITFFAREGSGIETTDDIFNQDPVFWPMSPGTGIRNTTRTVLEHVGVWGDLTMSDTGTGDIAGLLEEGQIDVIAGYLANGGFPPWFSETLSRIDMYTVEITDEFLQSASSTPGVQIVEDVEVPDTDLLDANTFTGWLQPNLLFIGEEISNDIVYDICRVSHEYNSDIQQASSIYPDHSDPENMMIGFLPDQPVHEGAKEYYREVGIWEE